MTAESRPAPSAAPARPAPAKSDRAAADRKSNAGATPDPWEACATLDYGADRSLAWSVREQVIAVPPEGRAKAEDRLLKALALPGVTAAGRAFVCQMLALIGSARSVPALAPLVRDPRTADAARYALEAIPGPEASAALREALGALSGPVKAGLIGSLAARRDQAAKPALAALKADAAEPALVRDAAARALDTLAASA